MEFKMKLERVVGKNVSMLLGVLSTIAYNFNFSLKSTRIVAVIVAALMFYFVPFLFWIAVFTYFTIGFLFPKRIIDIYGFNRKVRLNK